MKPAPHRGNPFRHALRGWICTAREERNFRIHMVAAILVVTAGLVFQVTLLEWALLLAAIGGVMTAELLNTAIENAADASSGGRSHPLIRKAKDAAAGAVLAASVVALGIGLLVFVPRLLRSLAS